MRNKSLEKIASFVCSPKCFWAILCAFVCESLWIALSASYPMPFDEDFHLGIIKLYAQQWSPFFAHQPAGGNPYGALTSDPSYLFHYLMSFPYRLTTAFTNSQMVQVVTLRCIDVALVAFSLVLFRKVLLKTRAPEGIVNVTLLFFILLPVVPLLAAQINYDDLLLPLAAFAVLTTMQVKERLKAGTLPVGALLKLGAVCMFASLVQFEFLPILAAITLYICCNVWRFKRQHRHELQSNWRRIKPLQRFAYVAVFLVAFALFGQRYGTNLVAYKTPVPQCNQVLTVADCSAYAPWARNYNDEQNRTNFGIGPVQYMCDWLYGMFVHSFFTSSGGGDRAALYVNVMPLPIISVTAIAVFCLGALLLLWYHETLLRKYPSLRLLLFISVAYCVTLWVWNYHDFVHLGAAVALNGRYLFPVAPLFLLGIGLAYGEWLGTRRNYKAVLLAATFVLFLQGGGALTFIKVSNVHWYWHGDVLAKSMNAAAQKVVKPLVVS